MVDGGLQVAKLTCHNIFFFKFSAEHLALLHPRLSRSMSKPENRMMGHKAAFLPSESSGLHAIPAKMSHLSSCPQNQSCVQLAYSILIPSRFLNV